MHVVVILDRPELAPVRASFTLHVQVNAVFGYLVQYYKIVNMNTILFCGFTVVLVIINDC